VRGPKGSRTAGASILAGSAWLEPSATRPDAVEVLEAGWTDEGVRHRDPVIRRSGFSV
jgi:hypothetical protein